MMDNEQITTSNGQCPAYEQLEAYVKGILAPEEAAAIERHLQECADCREICDAIKEADADFVDAAIPEINSRIDSRVASMDGKVVAEGNNAPKGRIIKAVFKYAAAAAVAGLCIWLTPKLVSNGNSGSVADDTEIHDDARRHKQPELPTIGQPESTTPSTQEQEPAAAAEQKAETTSTNTTVSTDSPKRQGKTDAPKTDNSQKQGNATKTDALQDEFEAGVVTRGANIAKPNTDNVVNTDKVEKLMVDAVRFYDEKDFTVAKALFERIVEEDPSNNDALKKLALCDYNLGNYGPSLKNLRRVTPKDETEKREIDGLIDECLKRISY